MAREEPKRKWRPGNSRNPALRRTSMGQLGEARVMWLRIAVGQFILQRYEKSKALREAEAELGEEIDTPPNDPEFGPSYILVIPVPGRRPVKMNFTALTEHELTLTRQFFDELFDLVEPIVKYRDKVAHNAFAEGDDSHARVYRQVPQFIVRSRTLREDDRRILDGPSSTADGAGGDDSSDGGLRRDGDELASSEPEADLPQDDGETTD